MPIETRELGHGVEVHVEYDDMPRDQPYLDDEAVKFVTFQRNSILSDQHGFEDMLEAEWFANDHRDEWERFDLYYYEHGQCAYAITPFSCPWDSGQVGILLLKKSEWGPDLEEYAKGVCDAITRWCNGESYGYIVSIPDDDHVDSCWGFDDVDWCLEEGIHAAQPYVDKLADEALPLDGVERGVEAPQYKFWTI